MNLSLSVALTAEGRGAPQKISIETGRSKLYVFFNVANNHGMSVAKNHGMGESHLERETALEANIFRLCISFQSFAAYV